MESNSWNVFVMQINLQNTQPIKTNYTALKPVSFGNRYINDDDVRLNLGHEIGTAVSTAVTAIVLAPVINFFSMKLFKPGEVVSENAVNIIAENTKKEINDHLKQKGSSDIFNAHFVDTPEPKPTMIDSLRKLFADHFDPKTNTAYTHKNRSFVMLHEMGHAADWNCSFIMRQMMKIRFVALAAAGIMIPMAYWHKNSDQQSSGGDWLNKHIGTISFLSFVPTLITEASASLRGRKSLINYMEETKKLPQAAFKKLEAEGKVVTPKMLKNFEKRMGWAYGTYLATALLTPLAIKLGIMVKDKIVSAPVKQREIPQYGYYSPNPQGFYY